MHIRERIQLSNRTNEGTAAAKMRPWWLFKKSCHRDGCGDMRLPQPKRETCKTIARATLAYDSMTCIQQSVVDFQIPHLDSSIRESQLMWRKLRSPSFNHIWDVCYSQIAMVAPFLRFFQLLVLKNFLTPASKSPFLVTSISVAKIGFCILESDVSYRKIKMSTT